MPTQTVYRTYTEGKLEYTGDNLEAAIRTWDKATHAAGHSVPGGVAVAVYEPTTYGLLQLRDGWILHVHEDGTVYLNPSLQEK
jgi:hypothetical protein